MEETDVKKKKLSKKEIEAQAIIMRKYFYYCRVQGIEKGTVRRFCKDNGIIL